MTTTPQPAPLAFSTAFGVVMVGSIAAQAQGPALLAAILGAVAVLAGIQFRLAASLAVLLTVSAIVLSDALRLEVKPFGVRVVVVQPATEIVAGLDAGRNRTCFAGDTLGGPSTNGNGRPLAPSWGSAVRPSGQCIPLVSRGSLC